MNALIENNNISEMACGSNFSYILSDNGTFLSTEYKVLQSQANKCFLKCMKMMHNGKIQFYFMTKAHKPFSALIPTLDVNGFITIVANMFSDIIEVQHNGFLSCQKIDASFNRIYVDPTTYKVSLVYIPIKMNVYEDEAAFENEIRTELVKLISGVSSLQSPKTMQLSADLSNGTLRIEDLYARIKGGKVSPHQNEETVVDSPCPATLKIIAMNAPMRVEITVNKSEFVIGKKQELCDGVIGFNKMISRSHCKIISRGASYSIMDLQSANGTYVNGVRLQPNQAHPIKNGDVIRLANSDFQVSIG